MGTGPPFRARHAPRLADRLVSPSASLRARPDGRGFTFLEVILAVSILAVVVLLATAALRVGLRAWEAGQRRADIQQESRALVELISEALAGASGLPGTRGPEPAACRALPGRAGRGAIRDERAPAHAGRPDRPVPCGRHRAQGAGRARIIERLVPSDEPFAPGPERVLSRSVTRFTLAYRDETGHGRSDGTAARPAGCRPRCGSSSRWRASPGQRRRSWSPCRWASRPSDASRPSRPDPERRGGRADRGAPPSRPAPHDRRGVLPGHAPRGRDRDELPLLPLGDLARRGRRTSGLSRRSCPRPWRTSSTPAAISCSAGLDWAPPRCPSVSISGSTGSVLVPDHRRDRAAQHQPGNSGCPGPAPPGGRRRENRARRDRGLHPGLARPERGAPPERGGERLLPRAARPLPVQERGLRQRGRASPGEGRHPRAPLRPPRGPWPGRAPHRLRHERGAREHREPRRAAGPGLCPRGSGRPDRTPPVRRSVGHPAGAPARQSASQLRDVPHRGLGGGRGARRARPHGGRRAADARPGRSRRYLAPGAGPRRPRPPRPRRTGTDRVGRGPRSKAKVSP